MKLLFNYFLRGLLFILPVFTTIYILVILVQWANQLFNELLFDWLPVYIPGLGLLAAILIVVLLGFFVTLVVTQPIFKAMERLMARTPFIKIIYSVIKDLTEALVGDNRRFNKPALITFADGLDRIGFITDGALDGAGIENRITVYIPHSYNFSGNLFLVAPDRVRPLNLHPADTLKFVVSAGVTRIDEGAQI